MLLFSLFSVSFSPFSLSLDSLCSSSSTMVSINYFFNKKYNPHCICGSCISSAVTCSGCNQSQCCSCYPYPRCSILTPRWLRLSSAQSPSRNLLRWFSAENRNWPDLYCIRYTCWSVASRPSELTNPWFQRLEPLHVNSPRTWKYQFKTLTSSNWGLRFRFSFSPMSWKEEKLLKVQ